MNKKAAKKITLFEAKELLPSWYYEMFENVISILKANSYNNFQKIENFVTNALSYIDKSIKPIQVKRVKVDLSNVGIKNGYQYIKIEIYILLKTQDRFLKLTKSMKVKLRTKMTVD